MSTKKPKTEKKVQKKENLKTILAAELFSKLPEATQDAVIKQLRGLLSKQG